MNFKRTIPTENYPLARFVSESGRWELGLVPVLFGVRVRAGLAGEAWCDVDYCAGDDPLFAFQLLAVMTIILESFPESASGRDVSRSLPRWERRPINKDECWPKLQAMARSLTAQAQSPKLEEAA